jgi:hypothetical protein
MLYWDLLHPNNITSLCVDQPSEFVFLPALLFPSIAFFMLMAILAGVGISS